MILSDQQLTAIRERAEHVGTLELDPKEDMGIWINDGNGEHVGFIIKRRFFDEADEIAKNRALANFITHSTQDIPALLAHVSAQKVRIAELTGALESGLQDLNAIDRNIWKQRVRLLLDTTPTPTDTKEGE